jgi:arylsulfatase A-like enzyme
VQLGFLSFLGLSAWCGLLSGLLEVGVILLRKHALTTDQFYRMSAQFVWMVPLINLAIFLTAGLLLSFLILVNRRRGQWLATRVMVALTLLPACWAAFPWIHGLGIFLVVLGISVQLVPVLERRAVGFRRFIPTSSPVLLGLFAVLAVSAWLPRWNAQRREEARPLPAQPSANVLLLVLDTVGTDHLSLHGYPRRTSPTLEELASRAIYFDRAQAPSSWTLPSHATMFTGMWPHELSVGWLTPLDGASPTLAGYLGSRGYATAGFVANLSYCASDSGLGRGFATYQDYIFPRLTALKTTTLVSWPLAGIHNTIAFLQSRLDSDLFQHALQAVWRLLEDDRKDAAVLNRELLNWLDHRRQPDRPFFAFLNYFDAHYPYELPTPGIRRFTTEPADSSTARLMKDWLGLIERGPSDAQIASVRDSYDDCVAHLDEYMGRLLDELERRRVLERTWVIIAGDHGESFGEHPGIFCHGMSLYQTEVHVPLLIVPPKSGPSPARIAEVVSLRDLPHTVVDVLGLGVGSPFPGQSLARFWKGAQADQSAASFTLSEVVPTDSFTRDPSLVPNSSWPLAALAQRDWTYIRREGDVREELFDARTDPNQTRDVARDIASDPMLKQMRAALGRLTAGPLTRDRFRP